MKKLFLMIACLSINILLQAQVSKTVNVSAGNLTSALTTTEKSTITNLTLTGSIDARDFKTMRDDMPILGVVDLSGVIVDAYAGIEGTFGTISFSYLSNTIPIQAFNNGSSKGKKSLTSITFPSSIASLGDYALQDCTGLTLVTIPPSVTSIGVGSFYGCIGLTSITIPTSVITIGGSAFSACTGLTAAVIPSSVIYVGDNAYSGCFGLTLLSIPSSITAIGKWTFSNCSGLTSITIPSSVTSIGEYAFLNCNSVISLNIPSSVKSIGQGAFQKCNNLSSVTIPSLVTSIGNEAFAGCFGMITVDINNQKYSSLDGVLFNKTKTILIQCPTSKTDSYTPPSSVTSIGISAFKDCNRLTSITIPLSVTSIGWTALYGCNGLSSIYAYSITPIGGWTLNADVFGNVDKNTCTLYVPIGAKVAYLSAILWQDFTNIVEFSTTGIDLINTEKISLYPNPTTDGFRVSGLKETSTLRLFDINGKLLLTKRIVNNEFVSVSSMPHGVYIVRISSQSGILEKKLVKK